jgi:hypothetical protein
MVINRQRQNALQTYDLLVTGSANEKMKEIVMERAAAAIFAPQETGYARGGSQWATPFLQIIAESGPTSKRSW